MDEIILHNSTPKKEEKGNFYEKQRTQTVWENAFIDSLKTHGIVTAACLTAGIDRTTAYKAKDRDSEFAQRWEDALEQACDLLEFEAKKRAMLGSDTLLIFLLKAHRPEKYRERFDVNLNIQPDKPLEEMSRAELDAYERKIRGAS